MSTVRTLFIRSVIFAYGPSFTIDGRYMEVQIANTSICLCLVIKRTYKASEIHESRSRPPLARYYMQKETKPSSHVITAAFGSVSNTERNEAVKSWDKGRFWRGIIACFDNNGTRPRFFPYIEEVHTRS